MNIKIFSIKYSYMMLLVPYSNMYFIMTTLLYLTITIDFSFVIRINNSFLILRLKAKDIIQNM